MVRRWDADAAGVNAVLDPTTRGVVRVLGGPGTGKTSLLIDAAAAQIAAGTDPAAVLLLTGAGRVGAAARSALTAMLLAARGRTGGPVAVREPLVRTVHGYAFAVLHRAAQRLGGLPPRLVTAAEQDDVIRDLLAGCGSGAWPESLHVALGSDGFAGELRNLLARCAERGVDPAQLTRLGRRSGRPEWVAAGRFAEQYEQVMLLRSAVGTAAPQATVPALSAAELVGAALEAFATDPDLLAAEQTRVRLLLVDDAQQLDPQAARLVRTLAAGVQRTLVAADPGQAVFGFRGGHPDALPAAPDTGASVTLTASYRCGPAVARAVTGIAGRLPGAGMIGRLDSLPGEDRESSVTVRTAASAHAEAALVADTLRRAHLFDGVPWSRMAVIVRSASRSAGRLSQTLAGAGVPVVLPAATGPLTDQPAVAALLTVLTAADDGLDGSRARTLLTGPIGRLDSISMRQLRRALRRVAAGRYPAEPDSELVAALTREATPLPAVHAGPVRRVRAVLATAATCRRDGRDPRYTLWQVWARSGLQRRWLLAAERGGTAGARAEADLAAVTELFDAAEQYVSRTAGASLRGFVDRVTALRLPCVRTDLPPDTEAVRVLSAHSALGQEWDVVAIAGLQEGLWPNTVPRGGVLHTHRLLDLLDGVDDCNVSARAPVLAEERRLLVAAMGRARRHMLVTAVDGHDDGSAGEVPSEFFTELAGWDTGGGEAAPVVAAPRLLSTAAVVGRLRGLVCAPPGAVGDGQRRHAARQLARLAGAGVPGADPADWYGTVAVSCDEPLRPAGDEQPVTLSPSSLQTLIDCPLRWLVERHGGTDGPDLRSTIGSVMHALVAEPGRSETELLAELDRAWRRLPFESDWYAANELDRHREMLRTFLRWRQQTRGQLTEVGVEVDVDGVVDGIRVRGRIDRLERDAEGRLVVVDVKTGKSPVSKDDAERHAQLAVYQLAVEAGLLGTAGGEPGGARLVYPAKPAGTGATERRQNPITPQARDQWREQIAEAVAAAAGPRFVARINDGCRHCPIRSICPAHTERADR